MKGRWAGLLWAMVLAAVLVSGCSLFKGNGPPPGGNTISVRVYFGARDAKSLEAEIHRFDKDDRLLQRAMETLAAGPRDPLLWPVLPPTTKVKGVVVSDRIATVDFSREIVNSGWGGSSREVLAVAAIVNTLTEFPQVERVQILVEGKKVNTLFGHMDVSGPLSRSPGIIREK